MVKAVEQERYTGITNLEVMREAINYNRFLLDLVLKHARREDQIADFGAGAGTFALPMAAAGHSVTCIEPDPTLSTHLAQQGLKVVSNLETLDDNSLDYIYSLNVLEHIADDAAILAVWLKKLRPGGRFLVYVPAFNILYSAMDKKVGHHRRYRLASLLGMLRKIGFQIDEATYVDSLGFPATLVYKILGNQSGNVNPGMLVVYDRFVFPVSRLFDGLLGKFGGKNLYVAGVKA